MYPFAVLNECYNLSFKQLNEWITELSFIEWLKILLINIRPVVLEMLEERYV